MILAQNDPDAIFELLRKKLDTVNRPNLIERSTGGAIMAFDQLKLENQLCFPLYACSREVMKLYKPFLDEIGLTYSSIALAVYGAESKNGYNTFWFTMP